ncbi:MAG: flagellar type III secretion system pore protein FliP [Acidimicrobiales bacterium]
MTSPTRRPRIFRRLAILVALFVGLVCLGAVSSAGAAPAQTIPTVTVPPTPVAPTPTTTTPDSSNDKVNIDVDLGSVAQDSNPDASGDARKPSKSIVILLMLTLLSVVPSLLICMTSFTRIVVVLSIARNAIGLQAIPPNQVITGLAVFLSLFVMAPTLKHMNDDALQPYLRGDIKQGQALKAAEKPLKKFMLSNTRNTELNLMIDASKSKKPKDPQELSLTTVIPAFILSELKSAFIIGVMVLLPFLIIDLVVSSGLMSLGMMMLPPVFVSLPFKLLLFVMVDGWALIAHALIANYH